jgi:hypothetical protein
MLGSDLFQDQLDAAAWTAPREPDRHDLVDALGWLPVRMPAVSRARLAAGTLGIRRKESTCQVGKTIACFPSRQLLSR